MSAIEKFAGCILSGNELVLVDVGAAYGLPLHLNGLERIATICFFEPHKPAAEKLEQLMRDRGMGKAKIFTEALSDIDGVRTLFVTNAPTGSSLLKPRDTEPDGFDSSEYFFPLKEVPVQTRQLKGILKDAGINRVDGIKIDVQGAELHVLKGAGPELLANMLSVEMEIGFPGGYVDQPQFGDIDQVMTAAGFRLFDLRPARLHRDYKGDYSYYTKNIFHVRDDSQSLSKRISETDAVYFKRADHLITARDPAGIRRAMVLMCCYGFHIEALDLNDRALIAEILSAQEHKDIRASVIAWHRSGKDVILDYPPFADALNRGLMFWQRMQRRFFGRHFAHWLN